MPSQAHDYFGAASGQTIGHLAWDISLFFDYANNPLVIVDDSGDRSNSIVSDLLTGHVLGTIGLSDRFDIGLGIPVVLWQDGDQDVPIPGVAVGDTGVGVGDLRIVPRLTLFSQRDETDDSGAALALLAQVFVPTGDDGSGSRVVCASSR